MPIYEYVCDACGCEKEVLQRMSDEPLSSCPACGKETFRKRLSAAGFRLKGSGWYETDFKTGSKKNLAESPAQKGGGSGSSDTAGAQSS